MKAEADVIVVGADLAGGGCIGWIETLLSRGADMPIQYINVRYTRERYGIIPRRLLDDLIASNQILQFYRESEQRWVTVGFDHMRVMGGLYEGTERRSPLPA